MQNARDLAEHGQAHVDAKLLLGAPLEVDGERREDERRKVEDALGDDRVSVGHFGFGLW